MKYNFDKITDRKHTNCAKWDMDPAASDDQMISMWVADMDFEVLPEVKEALQKRIDHGVFGYSTAPDSFFEAVQGWMKRRHEWDVKTEWMVPTSGVVPALKAIVNTFTNPGDEVLVLKPVYYPFDSSVESNDRKLIPFELELKDGQYVLDFEKLDQYLDKQDVKMAILCNPHNPVGKVWTEEELKKLGEILQKHNILVVSDEIHMDLVHKGHKHLPFLKVNPEMASSTIICTAPSKTFNLAGLQTSTLMIPDETKRKELKAYMSRSGMTDPTILGYIAAQAAYENGDQWVDQLNDYVYDNMMYVKDWLQEHYPQIQVIDPQGLYLMWIDFRPLGLDHQQLEQVMLKDAHLWLDEGYIFGKAGSGFERFNMACPRSTVKQALERLDPVLDQYLNHKTA